MKLNLEALAAREPLTRLGKRHTEVILLRMGCID